MSIKATVIINNYNYAEFLAAAIESVLHQTHKDTECIVVDDGSTDHSRQVISTYESVTTIFKKNGGQTSAIRAGLERASGEIILILDADDFLAEHAIERVVDVWTSETSLVLYSLRKLDLNRSILGFYPEQQFLIGSHQKHCLRWGEFPASPTSGNAFSVVVLRQLMARISNDEVPRPDGYLIFGACFFGDVTTLDEVLGTYLIHGKNASTSGVLSYETRRSQLIVDISHRIALARLFRFLDLQQGSEKQILSPHHWREITFMKGVDPDDLAFRRYGLMDICLNGISKFLTFPGLSWPSRIKNVAFLLLLPLLPRRLVARTVLFSRVF